MEMISVDQLEGFKGAIEEARKDETPYIGIKDDELHVLGDPNKTEIKPADYTVSFSFPNTKEWRDRCKANGDEIGETTKDERYFFATRKYGNVYLSPRRIGAVVSILACIESLLYKITENGDLKELTREEMHSVLQTLNGQMLDEVYELVATVLRIPFDEMEWLLPLNTCMVAVQIAYNNPSPVNEADLFFDIEPGNL